MRIPATSFALPLLITTLACSGGGSASTPAAGDATRQAMVAKIDSIVNAPITAGKAAGAALAVVRGNDTIAFKAYVSAPMPLSSFQPGHWLIPTRCGVTPSSLLPRNR
jgi:CubicO group peptidase (beta-lactamase class C family)